MPALPHSRRGSSRLAIALCLATIGVACGSTDAADHVAGGPAATEPAPAAPSSSSSSTSPAGGGDAGRDAAPPPGDDKDGDGIPDALEAKIVADYLPFFSVHPSDSCKTHGLLYRLSPHPHEPKRLMLWVDALYEKDCGANGHVGDDEVFGVVIDPAIPAPGGILAVRAISHQNTPCQHITTCGSCPGMTPCTTAPRGGAQIPVVYASKDKHGSYTTIGTCTDLICDFGGCALATTVDAAPTLNAGEPAKPLVNNLTTQGFVTAANGWVEPSLMNFDPWKAGNFGGAGDVSKDLVDEAFVVDTTACK